MNNDKQRKLVWQDTEKRGFLKSVVVGHFAMWATRQSPYLCPDDFAVGIEEFNGALVFEDGVAIDDQLYVETTCGELETSVCKALSKCETVMSWNVPMKGAQKYVVVSRYHQPHPDYDIIDVHALARNVAHSVWTEVCYDDGALIMKDVV